jgi:putative hydrolase of the HAD superfamily
MTARRRVWLFDLDDTLHDAGAAVFGPLNAAMTEYVERELAIGRDDADRLRRHYWLRYGATLLGLVRHHGVKPAHFLADVHRLPGLEQRLRCHPHDRAALKRLPGRKFVLTNSPRAYAERVLAALGLARHFDGVIPIERMCMFGDWRPKPDARMLRCVARRLRVDPTRCVLVEDTLAHQKAARRLGMTTVWMLRWVKRRRRTPEVGVYLHRKPVYVRARIRSLQQLPRVP